MQNPPVTQAYKAYYDNVLSKEHNNPDLIGRWGEDPSRFETQIMCRKTGVKVPDSNMYEDDGETFGPQRWPYDAGGNPNYSDPPIQYTIRKRMKCIGTTWWDWKNKRSVGLGFDFDSIVGHAVGVGVSDAEIARLDKIDVPWLAVIRSTKGKGRHIYIWFKEPYPITQNHNEHAALARAYIPLIAQYTGLDVEASVDVCGSVMWIHHESTTKENRGYELIKPATQILTADYVPPNWRDNLEVVSGSRAKVRVQGWTADGLPTEGDELDEMTQAHARIPLDETHLQILEDLERTGHTSLWVGDHHLWQGHTAGLKAVYDQWAEKGTPMRGLFDTNSLDSDPGKPNCFMRPKLGGGWDVYRFGEGCVEHDLWGKQGKWTHTTYNYPATLRQICLACGGFEAPDGKGGYMFTLVDEINAALKLLESKLEIPRGVTDSDGRTLSIRPREDDKVILCIGKSRGDKPVDFPRYAKTGKGWERVIDDAVETTDKEIEDAELWSDLDNKFRALKLGNQFEQWVIRDETDDWVIHPRENVKSFLVSEGHAKNDVVLGQAIFKCWRLVNKPFQPEYPGGREWNRNAAQFRYTPIELQEGEHPVHPTWDRLMNHCGIELNEYIPHLPWCKEWGITCGGDYLTAWVACMFQNPYGKLPYLFLYGPQNSGKSSFHEAIALLVTDGVRKADRALTSKPGYNGELENAILGVVDEVDISQSGSEAYNKLKEWVTGLTISIHAKYKQVQEVTSTLHFVQMANSRKSLPVFPGDTRITAMNVPSLEEEIARDKFHGLLKKEAPHYLRTLLDFEIPEASGRLMLPIIETQGKKEAAESNRNPLEEFIEERCYLVDGAAVTFKEFKENFRSTLEDYQEKEWSRDGDIKAILADKGLPIGRGNNNQVIIGNISFTNCEPKSPYKNCKGYLKREDQE